MKKILIAATLLLGVLTLPKADAQIRFHVNLNIGSQPDWGPVGYDHVDYYYMPDVDAYYDVPTHQYVYFENNVWVHRAYLPARYRGYDVYNGYKVVVNRPNPWLRHSYYRNTYARFRGHAGQQIIRDSRDARYQQHWRGPENRGPEHHDNGNHFGQRGGHGGDRGPGPRGDHGPGHDGDRGPGPGGDRGPGHGGDHGPGHGGGHGRP